MSQILIEYFHFFEWDPTTNTYSKKSEFTGTNGRNPVSKNALKPGQYPVYLKNRLLLTCCLHLINLLLPVVTCRI